jgi:hypothetical protein
MEQVHVLCFMPQIQKLEEPSPNKTGIFRKQVLVA